MFELTVPDLYEEIFLIFSGLPSPSKHYSLRVDNAVPMVTQPPQALQLQPQLIAQQQVPTQQFVPVSVMEQNGRQMLVTVSFSAAILKLVRGIGSF